MKRECPIHHRVYFGEECYYCKIERERLSDSSLGTGSLPDWFDVSKKVDRGEKLTVLEQFIYDFDDADPKGSDKFKNGLLAVLEENAPMRLKKPK